MKITTYTFAWAIGATVMIAPLNIKGIVRAVSYDGAHCDYQVEYFNNGEHRLEWILENYLT